MKGFWCGVLAGVLVAGIIFGSVAVVSHLRKKDREKIEYVELQQEIDVLREDIINRPADEFLEVPGVRRAADGARDGFDRKRDEALQRFRSRLAD
jgi:hypothetical protein